MTDPNPYDASQTAGPLKPSQVGKRGLGVIAILLLTPVAVGGEDTKPEAQVREPGGMNLARCRGKGELVQQLARQLVAPPSRPT